MTEYKPNQELPLGQDRGWLSFTGFIYILCSESMFKVGCTGCPAKRIKTQRKIGFGPLKEPVLHIFLSDEMDRYSHVESMIHRAANKGRMFPGSNKTKPRDLYMPDMLDAIKNVIFSAGERCVTGFYRGMSSLPEYAAECGEARRKRLESGRPQPPAIHPYWLKWPETLPYILANNNKRRRSA